MMIKIASQYFYIKGFIVLVYVCACASLCMYSMCVGVQTQTKKASNPLEFRVRESL